MQVGLVRLRWKQGLQLKKMNVDTKQERRLANQVNKYGTQVPDAACVAQ